MMPINWLMIFLLCLMCLFIMIIMLNSFLLHYKFKNINNNKYLMNFKKTKKWLW
nr:TPA_asm: ATP8 [Bombus perplexus]